MQDLRKVHTNTWRPTAYSWLFDSVMNVTDRCQDRLSCQVCQVQMILSLSYNSAVAGCEKSKTSAVADT